MIVLCIRRTEPWKPASYQAVLISPHHSFRHMLHCCPDVEPFPLLLTFDHRKSSILFMIEYTAARICRHGELKVSDGEKITSKSDCLWADQ